MRDVTFTLNALEQLNYWIKQDRKKADKIYKLLLDISRNGPMAGGGKPEKLKYRPGYSRRIDQGDRLVYEVDEENNIRVISCRGHYED